MNRRRCLSLFASLGVVAHASRVLAQQGAFRPVRPVKLISPLLPGGATDAIVRPIALRLGELWGQPVVVENRPGGGTVIGTQAIATAPADGHTFGIVISALTINPSLRNDLPYDTFRDITPIINIGHVTSALVAHAGFAATSVADVIARVKARPGAVSYASLGVGTAGHITAELLRVRQGLDWIHVPFGGSSAAYRELLPGRIPLGFVVLESALPHVAAGKLRVIALTDLRRNKLHPDLPLIGESVPGLGYDGIFGLVGPRGLPADIVRALNADIARVLAEPDIRRQLERQSMDVDAGPAAEFANVIRRGVEYWREAVKASGAHVG